MAALRLRLGPGLGLRVEIGLGLGLGLRLGAIVNGCPSTPVCLKDPTKF